MDAESWSDAPETDICFCRDRTLAAIFDDNAGERAITAGARHPRLLAIEIGQQAGRDLATEAPKAHEALQLGVLSPDVRGAEGLNRNRPLVAQKAITSAERRRCDRAGIAV